MKGRKVKNIIEPLDGSLEQITAKVFETNPLEAFKKGTLKDYPRSPLRYPGGKSRAITRLIPLILQEDIKNLCSPFFGGGSIELACISQGINVKGYDIFEPVVDFWQCVINNPFQLAARVKHYYPLERNRFYELQKRYISVQDKIERAAIFYALNRSSFSGTTLSGGMSPNHPRFTKSSIDRLREFAIKNLTIEKMSYTESIPKNEDAFLYLDPPYLNGQKLYGLRGDTHEGFDHKTLREMLDKRSRWILSYNDCPTIRKWYKDYKILKVDWNYGMNNNKQSNEIVVLSHDLAA